MAEFGEGSPELLALDVVGLRMTWRNSVTGLATAMFWMAVFTMIAVAAFAELLLAMPLPRWLYVAASVFILTLGGTVLTTDARSVRGHGRRTQATCLLALALLAALHLVPWTSRKPFLQSLRSIRIGMSSADVDRIMSGAIRGTGWALPSGQLRLDDSIVFRHSDDGRFNSDWGVVKLEDGKVVSIEFMPD